MPVILPDIFMLLFLIYSSMLNAICFRRLIGDNFETTFEVVFEGVGDVERMSLKLSKMFRNSEPSKDCKLLLDPTVRFGIVFGKKRNLFTIEMSASC